MENDPAKTPCPSDDELRTLFAGARSIAIVGAKDVPGQPVEHVGRYLIAQGFDVIPVHPKRKSAWGIPCSASIRGVDGADIVVLFRAPHYCAEHAREVLAMPKLPLCFWMQEGIDSPEAREVLKGTGILIVGSRCIEVEHKRLMSL